MSSARWFHFLEAERPASERQRCNLLVLLRNSDSQGRIVLHPRLTAFLMPRHLCVDWMGNVVGIIDNEVINDHRVRVD